MPPRRRGGNQRRAGGHQQANAPAVAEPLAAPPSLQRLLPNEVPLFQTGRNREQFWHAVTEATYKQVPTAIVRNMNALAVNVWDACGRKKTGRPEFLLEPKIKDTIWRFMGNNVDVDARCDPSLSTAALAAIATAKQQEICDRILRNLIKHLEGYAKKGYLWLAVKASDVFPTGFGIALPRACKDAATRLQSDWYWLFVALKPLRSTLEAAGFEADPSDPKQLVEVDAEADGTDQTKKVWVMRFSWS
eukprot:g3940.t1